jgi:hypothetical protein
MGATDANGMVPSSIFVSKTTSGGPIQLQVNSPVVLSASASNFNGGSTVLNATYIPLDASQRHRDINSTLTLNKVFGQNTYNATLPPPGGPAVNGFLKGLNGGSLASPTILMLKGQPTSKCADPSASITLFPSGNLNIGDLTKLFGSETPAFPVTVVACANPNGFMPDTLEVRATYQFKCYL